VRDLGEAPELVVDRSQQVLIAMDDPPACPTHAAAVGLPIALSVALLVRQIIFQLYYPLFLWRHLTGWLEVLALGDQCPGDV
jgi:hypothetical protein